MNKQSEENKSMRKRISISLERKVADIIETEAQKKDTTISQLVSQYLEHYIALRNRIAIKYEEKFTKEEMKTLKSLSQRILERPILKETVLFELKKEKNQKLVEKVKEMSECEINLLFSFLEV